MRPTPTSLTMAMLIASGIYGTPQYEEFNGSYINPEYKVKKEVTKLSKKQRKKLGV